MSTTTIPAEHCTCRRTLAAASSPASTTYGDHEYQSLIEDIKEVVFRTDAEGRWTFLNRAWEEALGFTVAESLGRVFLEYVHPDDRQINIERFQPLMARQKDYCRHEVRYLTKSGGFRWIEVYARLTFNEQGEPNGTAGTLLDVTLRRESAAALAQAKEAAESANRFKSEFLANMSHELRTPLSAVLTASESLCDGVYGRLSATQENAVRVIAESGRHLLGLINDILDLSKIEAGRMQLARDIVDIPSLCEASVRLVRQQALAKRLTVHVDVAPDVPSIDVDGRRIKQVLVNLLSNAVKFTPEHGRVSLEVRVDREAHQVRFEVTDTGIGMREADLDRLFKPFVQLDSSLAREFGGTGLGLSLARRLAELHGGSITVTSEHGKGSRFTVHLPVQDEVADARRDAPPVLASPTAAVTPAGRVLIVEDAQSNAQLVSDSLRAKGFRVDVATSGVEGVERACATAPDVVIMDVQMPGMDGLSAIRRIRRDPRGASIPIIALTAFAMAGDRERCLEAGANDYLPKPVTMAHLRASIVALLEARGQRPM